MNDTTPKPLPGLLMFMRCLAPFSCDRKGEGECYVCEAKRVLSEQAATIDALHSRLAAEVSDEEVEAAISAWRGAFSLPSHWLSAVAVRTLLESARQVRLKGENNE